MTTLTRVLTRDARWSTVLLLVGRWLQPEAKDTPAISDEVSGENAERGLEHA